MPSFAPEPPKETDVEVYIRFLVKQDADKGVATNKELYDEVLAQWRMKQLTDIEARERAFEISKLSQEKQSMK